MDLTAIYIAQPAAGKDAARELLLRSAPGIPHDPWDDRLEPAWLDAIAVDAPIRAPATQDLVNGSSPSSCWSTAVPATEP